MLKTVLYTAAHSGFDLQRIPLGGAATIAAYLTDAWRERAPFSIRLLGPSLLGPRAPREKDLGRCSTRRYARFCFDFERAVTSEILHYDPRRAGVLSNDVSEGPDFRRLAEKGFDLFTVYHVDVVDYVARLYLRGWVRPETLAGVRGFLDASPLRRFLLGLWKLVFGKQRDSVKYSRGLIVPSDGLKRTLLRCYPDIPPDRIHVLPWGSRRESFDEAAAASAAASPGRSCALSRE